MLFSAKSVFQDLRNFERGLEMVTLYIHLPPASDDIVGANRDARDVADENISKAQVIYSIIASTFEDTKRQKKEGQPHFSFEIVGLAGSIGMYVAVPFDIIDVVKQAVISAYPTARLEEVNDYNIFSQNISFQSVAGGEFSLKENYAFPIATYQDIKRDGIQALLSSMSGLQKDDGVAVQILMRPADNSWRKAANDVAAKKRKGKYNTKSGYEVVGDTLKQMAVALVKAPEEEKKDGPKEDISGLDRSVVEAIEDKTKYAGFETAVRVVVSSPTAARSDALLNNLVASFSLYDAPGKNGFKFEKAKTAEEITAVILLRAFPKEQR
jgi:hypothetical protein